MWSVLLCHIRLVDHIPVGWNSNSSCERISHILSLASLMKSWSQVEAHVYEHWWTQMFIVQESDLRLGSVCCSMSCEWGDSFLCSGCFKHIIHVYTGHCCWGGETEPSHSPPHCPTPALASVRYVARALGDKGWEAAAAGDCICKQIGGGAGMIFGLVMKMPFRMLLSHTGVPGFHAPLLTPACC